MLDTKFIGSHQAALEIILDYANDKWWAGRQDPKHFATFLYLCTSYSMVAEGSIGQESVFFADGSNSPSSCHAV